MTVLLVLWYCCFPALAWKVLSGDSFCWLIQYLQAVILVQGLGLFCSIPNLVFYFVFEVLLVLPSGGFVRVLVSSFWGPGFDRRR